MEFILDKIDEGLRKQLIEHSMREMKLKQLDNLLLGHENHVLTTYVYWLLQGVITDPAPQDQPTKYLIRDSQLQSWCDRLQRNYEIKPERIFDTLCNCTPYLIVTDTVNRVHLQRIKEDIQLLLFRARRRKHRKRNRIRIADDQVPASLQFSEAQTLKYSDNEEYLKATMHSSTENSNSLQKQEMIEISSDSGSDVEILGSCQETYHPRSHSTKQPPLVSPTHSDSCKSLGRILSDDDAALHLKKRMQSIRTQATKLRQETETEEEVAGKQKDMDLASIEQKLPNSQAEPFSTQPETAPAQRNQRVLYKVKSNAKPRDDYLCYRCEVAGHFLQDCPTNLDPAFDKVPVGGYKCMICGKTKAHLTSLCPDNTDPKSLTQLRLKFGTMTGRRSQEKNDYRSISGKQDSGLKEQRSLILDIPDEGFMNEDRRRAMLELDQDCKDQLPDQDNFESRYMQAKRAYSRRKSLQDDQVNSRHSSPPSKRFRHDDRKQNCDRESDHARDRPGGTRNSDSYTDRSELLASLDHHRADCGRLSYWDSEDQLLSPPNKSSPPKYRGSTLSFSPTPTKKQPLAQAFWSEDERVEEIRSLFPYADPDWVNDMAEFDVDEFFEELDGVGLPTASDAQTFVSIMDNF